MNCLTIVWIVDLLLWLARSCLGWAPSWKHSSCIELQFLHNSILCTMSSKLQEVMWTDHQVACTCLGRLSAYSLYIPRYIALSNLIKVSQQLTERFRDYNEETQQGEIVFIESKRDRNGPTSDTIENQSYYYHLNVFTLSPNPLLLFVPVGHFLYHHSLHFSSSVVRSHE